MHLFENTEIAFKSRSTGELKKAYMLFKFMSNNLLVKVSGKLAGLAMMINLPLGWILKPTVFSHFCGGETIEQSKRVIDHLADCKVTSILDFAAENQSSYESIEFVMQETLKTIRFAAENPDVPFTVFKPSAIAPARVLAAASSYAPLGKDELMEVEKFRENIRILCKAAYEHGIPILIDAEDSHYQAIIDKVAIEMMEIYNKEKVIVFNTLQMYRHDRLHFLNECLRLSNVKNYYSGIKLVRGAYMEKERERAAKMGYPSPVYPDKQSTDNAFNQAISLCVKNIDRTSLFVGTHNEESLLLLIRLMKENKLGKDDKRIYVSQLYGMSDNISFNMAYQNYNVAKYLPYGPLRFLLPYLIRRAEENTSVSGHTGREMQLLKFEIDRRKKTKTELK